MLSVLHAGPREQIQVIGLGVKHIYLRLLAWLIGLILSHHLLAFSVTFRELYPWVYSDQAVVSEGSDMGFKLRQ